MNDLSFLNGDVVTAAQRLLGCILERQVNGQIIRVRIVETEAYDQTDAASHSYRGRTPRNDVMFEAPGYLYVYFTYGMHYCCNIVTGPAGHGAAVLIRAVEPIEGEAMMHMLRPMKGGHLSDGPAKLCQALAIDMALNGHDLTQTPLKLISRPPIEPGTVIASPRIGISKAKNCQWRFTLKK